LDVTFDGSASTGVVSSYLWTFGDGETGYGVKAEHTYEDADSFTATLTVKGPAGKDSASVSIDALENRPPTVKKASPEADALSLEAGDEVTFSVSAANEPMSEALTYAWKLVSTTEGIKTLLSGTNQCAVSFTEACKAVVLCSVKDEVNPAVTERWNIIVTKKNEPPQITPYIEDETIVQGEVFTSIDLKDHIRDDKPIENLTVSAQRSTRYVKVTISDDKIATIAYYPSWKGEAEVTFTVTDEEGLSDSQPVIFTVEEEEKAMTFDSLLNELNNTSNTEIAIPSGTYILTEDLNITRDVKLIGDDATFILGTHSIVIKDPAHTFSGRFPFGSVRDVTMEGITIKGYQSGYGTAILNHSQYLRLKNCRIIQSHGIRTSAIYSQPYSKLYLTDTLIAENMTSVQSADQLTENELKTAKIDTQAIYLDRYADIYIKDSTIAANIDNSKPLRINTGYGVKYTEYDHSAIRARASNTIDVRYSILYQNEDNDISLEDTSAVDIYLYETTIEHANLPPRTRKVYVDTEDPLFNTEYISQRYPGRGI